MESHRPRQRQMPVKHPFHLSNHLNLEWNLDAATQYIALKIPAIYPTMISAQVTLNYVDDILVREAPPEKQDTKL